ncbi:MAG: hypothetical protein ACTS73_03040 [Arsenophonus sp. NEOnobi-MAG3]
MTKHLADQSDNYLIKVNNAQKIIVNNLFSKFCWCTPDNKEKYFLLRKEKASNNFYIPLVKLLKKQE